MIPKYHEIMYPLLKLISDGKEWDVRDVTKILADDFKKNPDFKMTDDELNQLLPSGQSTIFENRVGWARTYLKKALLSESPSRGKIKITQRGLDFLNQLRDKDKIDVKLLLQYPEFQEFKKKGDQYKDIEKNHDEKIDLFHDESPDEMLQDAYEKLKNKLKDEIISKLKTITPKAFENLIIDVLLKMGYGADLEDAGTVLGRSGDEGIDGIIKQDALGFENIYVQAKRWTEGVVGRPEIQKFVGALQGKNAQKGVLITTSKFTYDAKNYANNLANCKVILIDGDELAELMIKYNVGVTTTRTIELKRIDNDYFEGYIEL